MRGRRACHPRCRPCSSLLPDSAPERPSGAGGAPPDFDPPPPPREAPVFRLFREGLLDEERGAFAVGPCKKQSGWTTGISSNQLRNTRIRIPLDIHTWTISIQTKTSRGSWRARLPPGWDLIWLACTGSRAHRVHLRLLVSGLSPPSFSQTKPAKESRKVGPMLRINQPRE